MGIYRSADEHWIHIRPYIEDLPNINEIFNDVSYKTIIIPGSYLHIYNESNKEFVIKTKIWIQELYEKLNIISTPGSSSEYLALRNRNLRLLGICFGHQMICYSLQGSVRKRLEGFLCNKIESVKFIDYKNHGNNINSSEDVYKSPQIQVNNFWKCLFKNPRKLEDAFVCEIHLDEVDIIPPGFVKVGYSESCENEVLLAENKRILTFQGHPEYTPEYQIFDISPLRFKNLSLEQQQEYAHNFLKMQYELYKFKYKFRRVIFNFMNRKYEKEIEA